MNVKNLLGIHTKKRLFWEVDALRGFALIFMILIHLFWDLFYFNIISSSPSMIFGEIFRPRFLFLFLVGVSLFLSFKNKSFSYYVKKGLLLFFWGFVLSLIVWFFLRELILFGVLSLIGFSLIFCYPFLKINRWFSLLFGIFFFLGSFIVDNFVVESLWFVWVGFSSSYSFVDFFPIFPWLSFVLFGLFVGSFVYQNNKRIFYLKDLSNVFPFNFLQFLGRNTLFFYLIHQPIIFLILTIVA